MKELKIGEKVTIPLEVVEQSSCDGCYFDDGYTCHRSTLNGDMEGFLCVSKDRSDGKDVIFSISECMINIAEKLKDCPEGTKLYSPLYGEVEFVRIDIGNHKFPIIVRALENEIPYSNVSFTAEGKWYNAEQSECLLFPSKDNRDWNKFDYRIKPEYRPFANAEECIEEMKKHVPFGWVKDYYSFYPIEMIGTNFSKGWIKCYGIWFTPEKMFKDTTFLDGTPFGIRENF